MIKITLLFGFILANSIVHCQTEDCKQKIHEGTFITKGENNKDYRIERTEDSQIEYFNNDKSKIISKVVWISPSEYKIIVQRQVRVPKEMRNTPNEYTFKIIDCDGNYHTLENTFRGNTITFEMRRLEN